MRKILIPLILYVQIVSAGFEQTDVSPRARGLGGSYVALSDEMWAIFFNPGGLATVRQGEISFSYAPQPFGLSELSLGALATAIPMKFGVLGFGARKYGFDLYREITGVVTYANTISDIGVGVSFNYHSLSIKNYGSASTVGIDVGLLLPILDNLRWGIAARNLNAATIGASNEKLPQSFTIGTAYLPTSNLILTIDYQKESKVDPSTRVGVEYGIVEGIVIRGGSSTEPLQWSGGFGITYSVFQVDYAFSTHQELGGTHQASISIRWGGGDD